MYRGAQGDERFPEFLGVFHRQNPRPAQLLHLANIIGPLRQFRMLGTTGQHQVLHHELDIDNAAIVVFDMENLWHLTFDLRGAQGGAHFLAHADHFFF